MDDLALVLNAGSSSLKFCVYFHAGSDDLRLHAGGQIEGIGTSPRLTVKDADGTQIESRGVEVCNGHEAVEALAAWLRSVYDASSVVGVGHRIVHGGPRFDRPTIVTPEVLAMLRDLIPLAPLHQPYNLAAIDAVRARMPSVPQIACFDTSFHRGQPETSELLPLPREFRQAGMQRFGFHGLSYEYIASILPQVAPEIAQGRVIVAHLGSGASMCAIRAGKSIDSTFGFTALDGLCMGTRPGALDPGAVLHLFQGMQLSAKEVESILYKKSGLLGISGISNDMRDLLGRSEPEARLAIDYFVCRAAKECGGLASVLGGVDAIVFTAGIGQNSPEIRRRILSAIAWLGVELDLQANEDGGPRLTTQESKISAWVIPTNEELMIARHMSRLLG
jgi:acetate kinase